MQYNCCLPWLLCSVWRECIETGWIMIIAPIFLISLYPFWYYYEKYKMLAFLLWRSIMVQCQFINAQRQIDYIDVKFVIKPTKLSLKAKGFFFIVCFLKNISCYIFYFRLNRRLSLLLSLLSWNTNISI